jgi:beta-mannosidase
MPEREPTYGATVATKRVSLDGEWATRMCDPGAGESEGWAKQGFEAELTAIVPGHLQRDLVRAGLEPDFNHGENAQAFAHREGKDWWLVREFEVDDPSERMELCFEGIDAEADAWLNGTHLGRHANAHIPWTTDVSAALRRGRNRLVVRLDDGTRQAATREYDRYVLLADEELGQPNPRMWVRKPQYVWSWDWAPRLLTCGIWRSVELRGYDSVALRDVQMRTRFSEDGAATVEATCEIECFADSLEGTLELTLAGSSGTHVATVPIAARPGNQEVTASVEIAEPELWWPAPLGRPALYDCRVVVRTPSSDSDGRSFRYGLRTIELDRHDLGDEGESFTFVVNGIPTFCKGSGWQPPEHLFGCVDDGKLRRLIELAAAANMNMLRVNACGTYESDRFYELCDEHGILVWQDFPFTCSYYPDDDDEFCQAVREEAESAIRRLRNHASLAIWCGSNEVLWLHAMAAQPGDSPGPTAAPRLYGERFYDEILPTVCARLDPNRPYLPSTPWGGDSPNSDSAGCRHAWEYQFFRGPEDRINFGDIELDSSKFVAEFGYLGPSELSSLQRFLPEDQLQPGSPSWKFHDNRFEAGITTDAIERNWAPVDAIGLEDYLALGQLFQAEALGAAARHWRRRMFRTSGAISWGYVDCWATSTSWSLIDYYERPRAAYFHAMRAFEPLHVSLQQRGDAFLAWVVNDLPLAQEATLELGFVDLIDSTRISRATRVSAAATAAHVASQLDLPSAVRVAPERFVAYAHLLVGDEVVSRARATMVGFEYNRLRLPPPQVTVIRSRDAIELQADTYAFQLHLSTAQEPVLGDNWFDLLPGETRTISLSDTDDQTIVCWSFADGRNRPHRMPIAELRPPA